MTISNLHFRPLLGHGIVRRSVLAMLFVLPGPILWRSAVAAPKPAGRVVAITGSCTARNAALKRGGDVQIGDAVSVPVNGKLKLQMVDGSEISVASGSSMTVRSYNVGRAGREARLSLSRGLLRAIVVPTDGPSTFEITTAVGTASARSADWFIEVQADAAQVGVLSGSVDLTSAATRQSVSIPARWGTRLEAKRDPVPPRVWAHMEFDAFIRRVD